MKNDTGLVMTVSEYFDNGRMKSLSSQVNINSKFGGSYSTGKTGVYKEYYENEDFNTEFDYKGGSGE